MARRWWFDVALIVALGVLLGVGVARYAGAADPEPLPALDCSDPAPGTTCDPTGDGSPSPVLGPAPSTVGPAYPPGDVSDGPVAAEAASPVAASPRFTG